jgi:hydrogenase maturation factor
LIAVDPDSTAEVVASIRDRGIAAAVIGQVESGAGVVWDGEPTQPPAGDSSWPVYEALLESLPSGQ